MAHADPTIRSVYDRESNSLKVKVVGGDSGGDTPTPTPDNQKRIDAVVRLSDNTLKFMAVEYRGSILPLEVCFSGQS